MRALLVSNWEDQCGISEYGRNLLEAADPSMVEVVPFEVGRPPEELLQAAADVDVVHINYQQGVSRPFDPGVVLRSPVPVVYTNHLTAVCEPWYQHLAGIAIHEPDFGLQGQLPHVKVRHIPLGVAEVEFLEAESPGGGIVLGHAGFPLPHKRHDLVCAAARYLRPRGYDVRVFMIMPETYRASPRPLIDHCRSILGDVPSEFVTDWMLEREVVRLLHAKATVCVYPGGIGPGVSGSVRLAAASLRPLVINERGPLFADLLGEPGVYPYKDLPDLPATILRAHGQEGPVEFVRKRSYREVMKLYCQLYREVLP